MVFETTAYADSAIKPTSLLDHTKGDPKRVLLWLPVSTLGHDGDCTSRVYQYAFLPQSDPSNPEHLRWDHDA